MYFIWDRRKGFPFAAKIEKFYKEAKDAIDDWRELSEEERYYYRIYFSRNGELTCYNAARGR